MSDTLPTIYKAPAAYINELEYISFVTNLLASAPDREDRTNTGTISVFSRSISFDITDGRVPLLSSKFVSFHNILHELIWMISGTKKLKYLKEKNVNIWDSWLIPNTEVMEDGKLVDGYSSSIYGESWREWEDTRVIGYNQLADIPEHDEEGLPLEHYDLLGDFRGTQVITRYVDQLKRVVWLLRNKPTSRRIILEGWNAARVGDVKLPPCHKSVQFYVNNDNELEAQVYLRSNDVFLGMPYNIVQYALLAHLLAKLSDRKAAKLHYVIGDAHIYSNHLSQTLELSKRFQSNVKPYVGGEDESISEVDPKVEIVIDEGVDILSFNSPWDIDNHLKVTLTGYEHLPAIKADVAV